MLVIGWLWFLEVKNELWSSSTAPFCDSVFSINSSLQSWAKMIHQGYFSILDKAPWEPQEKKLHSCFHRVSRNSETHCSSHKVGIITMPLPIDGPLVFGCCWETMNSKTKFYGKSNQGVFVGSNNVVGWPSQSNKPTNLKVKNTWPSRLPPRNMTNVSNRPHTGWICSCFFFFSLFPNTWGTMWSAHVTIH